MKDLEQAPIQAVEKHLRDAFGAAADTITAQDLAGLPVPGHRGRVARRLCGWAPRLRAQPLVPLAAAVGVAVAVAAVTLVVPRLQPGPVAGPGGAGPAGAPKFFAGVTEYPPGQSRATVVNIYRSATGRVAASIRPPKPYHAFVAVSRLGGDRTFVAAAITAFSPAACTSHLFRFSIDGQGHPSTLTPLSVPQVTGQVAELVSSANGKTLAYTVYGCATGQQAAGVINLATRQATTWAVPHPGHLPVSFGSLSLAGDGSKLGFAISTFGSSDGTNAYVLPTGSPPGLITQHASKVLHVPTGVDRVVLSNDGSQAYVETRSASRGGAVVLGQYSTTTGQRVRLLSQLSPGGRGILGGPAGFSVTVDAAGRHLLAYNGTHRLTAVNLTTGHQTPITAAQIPYLDSPYNTAAW